MLHLLTLLAILPLSIAIYIFYQRFLHPLSKFPGPFLASFTPFWRVYHELRGDLPRVLHSYHQRYGSFIRVSPDEIDTDVPEVIDTIYKGGRNFPKSDFYKGFTTVLPDVFGTQNEEIHSTLRRQMGHAFSQSSLMKMEPTYNKHVRAFIAKLDTKAKSQQPFVLDDVLNFLGQDTSMDLSMGVDFGSQAADDMSMLPPLNDNIALGKLTGYVPWLKPFLDRFGMYIPWPYLRTLLKSRQGIKETAEKTTDEHFEKLGRTDETKTISELDEPEEVNLFTYIVRAKDPETGVLMSKDNVITSAVTFNTAGSHTTTATLQIFFWYLVHYPEIRHRIVEEIQAAFGAEIDVDEAMISYNGMEAKLPYTSAFFKECFRLTPTFQHPSPRVVPSNILVADTEIPTGMAISTSIYSLHRNPSLWGPDAEDFNPDRWMDSEYKKKERFLYHFGAGHRTCVGRNQALILLWKTVVEVLRRFEVTGDGLEEGNLKEPRMVVRGFAELEGRELVRVERRA